MSARSSRADVRNPLLTLPAAQRMAELDPASRDALRALLLDFKAEARERANECWRKHKPPMAAYWKAWAVNAGHAARLLRGAP
jgi:hypothetical protein